MINSLVVENFNNRKEDNLFLSGQTTCPEFTKLSANVAFHRGSVLPWQHCNILRTSNFVDDVIFPITGPMTALCYCNSIAAICDGLKPLLHGTGCGCTVRITGRHQD